jgi:predicted phosphodiesterase
MPRFVPPSFKWIYPALGTSLLEEQIRKIGSQIHIYGHSHLNRRIMKDNTLYINNAYGYPSESRITAKKLLCIYEM